MGISKARQRLNQTRRASSNPLSGYDLNELEGLLDLAAATGNRVAEPPSLKSKAFSALRGGMKILNAPIAAISGFAESVVEGTNAWDEIKYNYQNIEGFGDTFQALAGRPDTRGSKIATGVIGFGADVLFDPLTYLSFGVSTIAKRGVQVGTNKALNGVGQKLYQEVARDANQRLISRSVPYSPEGLRLQTQRTETIAKELMDQATSNKALDDDTMNYFVSNGIAPDKVEKAFQAGTSILDRGGIKFAGKSWVTGETVGRYTDRAVGIADNTPVLSGVMAFARKGRDVGAKLFVSDRFGADKRITDFVDSVNREMEVGSIGMLDELGTQFGKFKPRERQDIFEKILAPKLSVVTKSEEIFENAAKQFQEKFGKEISNYDQAVARANRLDTAIIPSLGRAAAMTKRMGKYGESITTLQIKKELDELDEIIRLLKQDVGVKRGAGRKAAETITDGRAVELSDKIISSKEKRLLKELEAAREESVKVYYDLQATRRGELKKKQPVPQAERLVALDKALKAVNQTRDEVAEQRELLRQMITARTESKLKLRSTNLKFDNPEYQQLADFLFNGDQSFTKRLQQLAGIDDVDAIKYYIPSIFNTEKLGRKGFSSSAIGSVDGGFQKEFKGVRNENLVTDALEAYGKGGVNVLRQRIKTDSTKAFVKQMGHLADDVDIEEIKAFNATAEKGFRMVKFNRKGLDGNIKGWIPEWAKEGLEDLWEPNGLSTIDELARITGFDWATGMFKTYVTQLFPSFFVRNITGNQFNQMIKLGVSALDPETNMLAGQAARGTNLGALIPSKTGARRTLGSLLEEINKKTNLLDKGAFSNIEYLLDTVDGKRTGTRWLKHNQRFGEWIDQQGKMNIILNYVREGKSVDEAIKAAEDALFNYSKLTQFERSIMRRLIPFYTFSRKNFEFQMKALAHDPGRVAAQLKGINAGGDIIGDRITEEDEEGLPSYMMEGLGIKAGANKYGQEVFITGFGLPIEEFFARFSGEKGFLWNSFDNVLAQSNPILKYPLEKSTGTDLFRQKPIDEIYNATEFGAMLEGMREISPAVATQFADMIDLSSYEQQVYVEGEVVGTERRYTANPQKLHFLRNLPTARITATTGFLSDPTESNTYKGLRFLTGVRGQAIDEEQQKFYNEMAKKTELIDYFERLLGVREFRSVYVPEYRRDEVAKRINQPYDVLAPEEEELQ